MEQQQWLGLTSEQAEQNRLAYGRNVLPERKLKPWWQFFLETFEDKLNLILLGMLIVFVILAAVGQGEISEPIGIGVVLLAIAVINTRTGLKSQKSAKDLKDRTSIRYCNIVRDGKVVQMRDVEIVVGDLVIIQSGEAICADGYLVDGEVSVDNSVLNGESKPCHKCEVPGFTPVNKEHFTGEDYVDANSLFSGTTVVDGEGKMIVTRVGEKTVNGQTILSMDEVEETKTSLELQLDHLAGQISRFGYIGAIVIALALLGTEVLQAGGISEYLGLGFAGVLSHILLILTAALTIVVAAVPEGLPLIISLITAQNARTMIRHNVLAKHTNKIPEAGNIQLLCTDKTGTLTYGNLIPVSTVLGDGTELYGRRTAYQEHAKNIVLNSNAMYDAHGSIIGGNATERALLSQVSAQTWAMMTEELSVTQKLSFNSANKFSAAEVGPRTYYKGAPERILEHATHYLTDDGVYPIDREAINGMIESAASRAMRVIATAYYDGPLSETLPDGLVLTALVYIRDDVRTEVPAAVSKMQGAGVQVMMVTGDVLPTAIAIAKDAGILAGEHDLAMTASEFEELPDQEALEKLPHIKVIARATPQTKLRIVRLAQDLHLCVGMTGDGTNDAPAIKAADVGFSMGSGTDVCKEAGDIIITDDNFVSITDAVLLGRTFMHNVLKFLKFQLPINVSLVILSVLFPVFFAIEAFAAVQILIVNIVMDSLNSLSFGGEPAKDEYMLERPIPKGSKLLSSETMGQIGVSVAAFLFIFALTTLPFFRTMFPTEAEYGSMRFALLMLVAVFNGFNIRTDHLNLFRGLSENPNFYRIAIGIMAGAILLCTFGGNFLHCAPLNAQQWAVTFVLALLVIPIDLIRKILKCRECAAW